MGGRAGLAPVCLPLGLADLRCSNLTLGKSLLWDDLPLNEEKAHSPGHLSREVSITALWGGQSLVPLQVPPCLSASA